MYPLKLLPNKWKAADYLKILHYHQWWCNSNQSYPRHLKIISTRPKELWWSNLSNLTIKDVHYCDIGCKSTLDSILSIKLALIRQKLECRVSATMIQGTHSQEINSMTCSRRLNHSIKITVKAKMRLSIYKRV